MRRQPNHIVFFLTSMLALCSIGRAQANEPVLHMFMNQAKILRLDRGVAKVIVGNAKIADATVADPRTIILTGHDFGATNIVLLDSDGNAIFDQRILVSMDEGNTIRVFRQTERTILSCTPICQPPQNRLTLGE